MTGDLMTVRESSSREGQKAKIHRMRQKQEDPCAAGPWVRRTVTSIVMTSLNLILNLAVTGTVP